jgi:hypothetical protein
MSWGFEPRRPIDETNGQRTLTTILLAAAAGLLLAMVVVVAIQRFV